MKEEPALITRAPTHTTGNKEETIADKPKEENFPMECFCRQQLRNGVSLKI